MLPKVRLREDHGVIRKPLNSKEVLQTALFAAQSNPFSALTVLEQERILTSGRTCTFKSGQYLFRSSEPVLGIFCLVDGIVRVSQSQGEREIMVRLASAGEWVGHRSVFTSETYRGSARAKETTRVHFVPTAVLFELLANNKDFANRLIRLIARDLESVEKRLMEHQKLSVPSRLISLFRALDSKIGIGEAQGRRLSAKISKVEIAEMVGASQEVVSRQLSKWKKEGLLRESDKRLLLSKALLNRVIR